MTRCHAPLVFPRKDGKREGGRQSGQERQRGRLVGAAVDGLASVCGSRAGGRRCLLQAARVPALHAARPVCCPAAGPAAAAWWHALGSRSRVAGCRSGRVNSAPPRTAPRTRFCCHRSCMPASDLRTTSGPSGQHKLRRDLAARHRKAPRRRRHIGAALHEPPLLVGQPPRKDAGACGQTAGRKCGSVSVGARWHMRSGRRMAAGPCRNGSACKCPHRAEP